MKKNESFFLDLVNSGKLYVNPETGEILSRIEGKASIQHKTPNGYFLCRFRGFGILSHRLVYLVRHGDLREGFEINHKNGIKSDNRIDNLEEVTRSQNVLHARHVLGKVFGIFDRDNTGENNGRSVVTREQVEEIRKLFATGKYTQISLANKFGLKKSQVYNIVRNKQWI